MADNTTGNNFRSPVMTEPLLIPTSVGAGGPAIRPNLSSDAVLRTPAGNVRSLAPPPLPGFPRSELSLSMGSYGGYNNGFGSYSGLGYGNFGGYGGYGSSYNNYSRFGTSGGINPIDPESRFIQLAEASSRPAFQSIETLVSAIGNISSMLDSTFFAITSSFRAILAVAANFGRLRGVFAKVWSTFAIFRGLSCVYRKILYWLHISNLDPSSETFKSAFAEAMNETKTQQAVPNLPPKGQSPWPVLAFLSFIFTAPYLIMKLFSTVSNAALEEARNPCKWIHPIESIALYDFQARNPSELNMREGQRVIIAPKEIQNSFALLNTGWAMATTDGQMTGIIPINYVKSPQQMRQEELSKPSMNILPKRKSIPEIDATQQNIMNLSASAFSAPPTQRQTNQNIPNDHSAPQPVELPTTENVTKLNDM